MTNSTLTIIALPAMRIARLRAEANDVTEIGAVVATLLDRVEGDMPIRTFYGRPDGSKIDVAVGRPATSAVDGLDLVDLPAVERAASVIHRGPAEEIGDAWQTLDVGLAERGLESYGLHRLIHRADGVELQCPVRELGSCTFAPGEHAAETS